MSDTEYENFEITDYDLDNEFNPNRARGRLTKHQQIYGIWADDGEKEGNEIDSHRRGASNRAGFAGSFKGTRGGKDYTLPVNFIPGGIQQSGKNKKNDGNNEKASAIFDDEDSQGAQLQGSDSHHANLDVDGSSSDESNFATQERDAKLSKQKVPTTNTFTKHGNMGAWEQHTRGIGAKLLLQMGYEPGKGLGKDLQGMSHPLEARVRKGRGAIGAYGPEVTKNMSTNVDTTRESKECKEKVTKWKKTSNTDGYTEKSNKRYFCKTVEEVLEKGKKTNFIFTGRNSEKLTNVPVIDMTGPEKRILSGYHALGQSKIQDEELYGVNTESQKKSSSSCGFALPELLHNLSLIVNMCEQEIISLDNVEHSTNDRYLTLEIEKKQLEEIVRLESDHINTLEKALQLVKELTDSDSSLTLQSAEQIFLELQRNYTAEYKEFSLGDLAASVIVPLVKKELIDWQPLENPTLFVDLIKKWRSILEAHRNNEEDSQKNIFDPYSSLIWAGVVPSFRACAEHWESKNYQSMAALLDCWAPLLPSWVLDSVLEQLVLPRLCAGVRNWDPLTDTFPIHVWILPWNSILGHKMEEFIFPAIREKLGNALQAWMPHDRSARAMLMPWKSAFDVTEMEIFLMQHIIPKLQSVLNDLIINPMQQDLELWNQVWEWHEIIPTIQMARLLDKHFFPKWMQVLVLWLNQSPNFMEIMRWFTGWKSMLSEEILRETTIKEHFRRALEIMNRATNINVTNAFVPTAELSANTTQMTMPTPLPAQSPQPPPSLMDLQFAPPAQLEFKELVSRRCAERGILFAPIPGRKELGKQVYRIGNLFCYIDRNVCMASDNSFKNWMPSLLPNLLESALSGNI